MKAKWIAFLVVIVLIIIVPLYFYFQPNVRHLELTDRDRVFLGSQANVVTTLFEFDSNVYRIHAHHYHFGQLMMEDELGVFGGVNHALIAFNLDMSEYHTEYVRLTTLPNISYVDFDIETASVSGFTTSGEMGSTFRLSIGEREVIAVYQLGTTPNHVSTAYLPNATIDLDSDFMESFERVDHAIFISVERVEWND